MRHKYKHYSILLVLIIFLTGLTACQQDRPEVPAETVTPGKAAPVSTLTEMLASMSMYHFTETVEAPAFELESVDGATVNLSQFRGNVIFLSFWTTW